MVRDSLVACSVLAYNLPPLPPGRATAPASFSRGPKGSRTGLAAAAVADGHVEPIAVSLSWPCPKPH